EEQAKQEAEIERLEHLLRNAEIGDAPADDGKVEPGMIVTIDLAGSEMVFLLASREMSSHSEHEVFSTASPLGTGLMGIKPVRKYPTLRPMAKKLPSRSRKPSPTRGN